MSSPSSRTPPSTAPLKTFSVAKVRADLAGFLVKAQHEVVIIARYGKPVGLLLGLPPSARLEDIKALSGWLPPGLRAGLRALSSSGASPTPRAQRTPARSRKRRPTRHP